MLSISSRNVSISSSEILLSLSSKYSLLKTHSKFSLEWLRVVFSKYQALSILSMSSPVKTMRDCSDISFSNFNISSLVYSFLTLKLFFFEPNISLLSSPINITGKLSLDTIISSSSTKYKSYSVISISVLILLKIISLFFFTMLFLFIYVLSKEIFSRYNQNRVLCNRSIIIKVIWH